jgi:hypothetical protein
MTGLRGGGRFKALPLGVDFDAFDFLGTAFGLGARRTAICSFAFGCNGGLFFGTTFGLGRRRIAWADTLAPKSTKFSSNKEEEKKGRLIFGRRKRKSR